MFLVKGVDGREELSGNREYTKDDGHGDDGRWKVDVGFVEQSLDEGDEELSHACDDDGQAAVLKPLAHLSLEGAGAAGPFRWRLRRCGGRTSGWC